VQLLRFLKKRHPLKKSPAISGPVYVYANQKNAGDILSAKGIQAAAAVEFIKKTFSLNEQLRQP
jgi:hypothetical protein